MARHPRLGTIAISASVSSATLAALMLVQGFAFFRGELTELAAPKTRVHAFALGENGRSALAILMLEPRLADERVRWVAGAYDSAASRSPFRELPTAKVPWAVTASSASRYGFLGATDGSLYWLDLAADSPKLAYLGRHRRGYAKQLACTPDGAILIVAGTDVTAWDRVSARRLWRVDAAARCVCFLPGTDRFVYGLSTGEVLEVDAATGATVGRIARHGAPPGGVAASPDGRHIASIDQSGDCLVTERATGRIAWSCRCWSSAVVPCFSPDGQRLFVPHPRAGVDLAVVDLPSGRPVAELRGWKGRILHIASAANDAAILHDSQGNVSVWNADGSVQPLLGPATGRSLAAGR